MKRTHVGFDGTGRSCGHFVAHTEVPLLLANGWTLLDQLVGDPLGREFVLLAPSLGWQLPPYAHGKTAWEQGGASA
jgi:hypothetical protein